MRAAHRTQACRLIQYHSDNLKFDGALALQKEIIRFIKGIRGPRQKAVTQAQILAWFRATDATFVRTQLSVVCGIGPVKIYPKSLSSSHRYNGNYVYGIDKG